ncbi:unnamed protein product [Phytophthora fragariaefolia]|uniref:Unnamed protein product n=1 Tax=Phytophthora fragariaefolia TaxID=1490495 RepID=A0A9W6YI83_9STRA|nr:unnamed protein product [Phytophthora fragariaefolia]
MPMNNDLLDDLDKVLCHSWVALILYELREVDFFEASRQVKARLESDDQDQRDMWTRATKAFVTLKDKIVNAPILTHLDSDKRPVVILYASKWAISAALVQEYEGAYKPVTFTSRTLKPNEINYGIVDNEVLALLRMLDVCYTQLVTRSIKVLTRHSTLAWMLNSSGLQGRLGRWAALLSNWTMEIVKCTKGEDEILGVIAASITPQEDVDSILTSIALGKQPRHVVSMPPPTVEPDEELLVVSFDWSALVKAMTDYLWRLQPGNTADAGEIECKAPSLKLLWKKAMEKLRSWPNHEFLHVKTDWNQSADNLASAALQREAGKQVTSQIDIDDLTTLNRLAELLVPRSQLSVVKIAATTRARQRQKWIVDLKKYLTGDVRELTSTEAKSCAKIAEDYEIDEAGLLFYCPSSKQSCEDRDLVTRLVIPETLQEDVPFHYYTIIVVLKEDTKQYVGEYVDCETGKGRPTMEGESPGNLQATYPLQIIAMDHIPSLPKSYKGNTELLIWIDLFTGNVVAKASASLTAQTIAETMKSVCSVDLVPAR